MIETKGNLQRLRKTLPPLATTRHRRKLDSSEEDSLHIENKRISLFDPNFPFEPAPTDTPSEDSPFFDLISSKIPRRFSNLFGLGESDSDRKDELELQEKENQRTKISHLESSEERPSSIFGSALSRISRLSPNIQLPHLPELPQIPSPSAMIGNIQRNFTHFVSVCFFL